MNIRKTLKKKLKFLCFEISPERWHWGWGIFFLVDLIVLWFWTIGGSWYWNQSILDSFMCLLYARCPAICDFLHFRCNSLGLYSLGGIAIRTGPGWGFFSFLQFLDVLRPTPLAWSDCSSVCDWVSVLTWTLLHPNPLQVYSYSYICFLLPFLGHFDLKDKLLLQLMSSLVWSHAVLWMCSPGPTSFVEFFPGHILSDHRLPEASVRPLIA